MSTFYTDHWKEIEPERLERYEALFQFRAEQEPFLAALNLDSAKRVLDFGCGPGHLSEAIAERTEADVVGADLNAEFVTRAIERKKANNLSFVHLTGTSLIDEIGNVDRLLCKNVLEYVPDLDATLSDFSGVLTPGGEIVVIDSDWGFVLVEPWGKERTDAFFADAAGAFKEMLIGRKVPAALVRAGFEDVDVKVIAGVDRKGRGISVLQNMGTYIQKFDTRPVSEVKAMLAELDAGLEDGSYMFILPQFVISARKP